MAVIEGDDLIPSTPLLLGAAHKFEDFFLVYNIYDMKVIDTGEVYGTSCGDKWTVEIKLGKEVPFKDFKLHVTVKRSLLHFSGKPINTGNPAKVVALIWFYNLEGKKCPVPYRLDCELTVPLREKTESAEKKTFDAYEHYTCLLGTDKKKFPRDVLVIRAQLFVKGCCIRNGLYKTGGGKYSDDKKRYDLYIVDGDFLCRPYNYKHS